MSIKVKISTLLVYDQLAETHCQRGIVRDSTGKLWIVYREWGTRATSDLLVAYSTDGGETWTEEVAVVNADAEVGLSILLNSSNVPIIIYTAATADEIRYADRSGDSWNSPETVYTQVAAAILNVRACIDSTDAVHIVFNEAGQGNIYYIKGSSGSWGATETVDSGSASEPNIAVNSSDEPFVVFKQATHPNYGLFMRYKTGGAWQGREMISSLITDIAYDPSIAIDSAEDVHVAWREELVGYSIMYRKRTSGVWGTEVNVDNPDLGYDFCEPILTLDTSDNAYVIYQHDRTASDEKVYYQKITSEVAGGRLTLDATIERPNTYSSVYAGLWAKYPSSCQVSEFVSPVAVLLDEDPVSGYKAIAYFYAEKYLVKALKGNPNIDQLIYQHVERMD